VNLRSLLTSLGRRPQPSGGALIPALDALRGVAVLAVFAQHLGDAHMPFVRSRVDAALPAALAPWVLTVLHHAHWGVDLFFVLSGFSLAQPLLARLARAGPGARAPLALSSWGRSFALRRAARIYPGYLAALALVIVVVPSIVREPAFVASLAVHAAMLQGYFTPGGLAIIGAAWSLSTEVSFYAAWPFLAPRVLAPPASGDGQERTGSIHSTAPVSPPPPAAPRASLRPWLAGAAIVIGVWLIRGALHELAIRPGAPPWLLEASQRRWAVSRLDQFVLGALAAAAHARLARWRVQRLSLGLCLLGLAALPPAFYLDGSFLGTPLGAWPYSIVSIATAALVLGAASVGGPAARWLFPRALRWVGVVSYGVFLNHQLAIGVTAAWAGAPGSWASLGRHAALSLSASLVIGWLSWVLVERPVIERAAGRRAGRSAGRGA
jgi:peptidoglycan/LPS O-acetylase OafA/YrhL